MKFLAVGFCLLFCFAPLASAQEVEKASEAASPEKAITEEPSTLQPIQLGILQEEVRERWGAPHTIYIPPINEKDTPTVEDYDWGVHVLGLLSDAFRRKTETNEYEVRVFYAPDRRKSQDDPEIRVASVELKPSKPITLLPMLQDLPEAFELCNSGCEMWGSRISTKVMVFPRLPSLRQSRTARLIAYGWKPMPLEKRDDRDDWTLFLRVFLKKRAGDDERTVREIDWMNRPVEQVKVTIDTPRLWLEFDKQAQTLNAPAKRFYEKHPELFKRFPPSLTPEYLNLGTFPKGDK